MPRKSPPDPDAQRRAMQRWVERHGSIAAFGRRFNVALRQVQRFTDGSQMIPPGLCREVEHRERSLSSPSAAIIEDFAALGALHWNAQHAHTDA